jgi:hypothetical protein
VSVRGNSAPVDASRRDVPPSATPRDTHSNNHNHNNNTHSNNHNHNNNNNHHLHPSLRPIKLSALLRDHPTSFDPLKLRISVVDRRLSVVDGRGLSLASQSSTFVKPHLKLF